MIPQKEKINFHLLNPDLNHNQKKNHNLLQNQDLDLKKIRRKTKINIKKNDYAKYIEI